VRSPPATAGLGDAKFAAFVAMRASR